MIEWSDEAIAAALRVWLRLSEVGEFRDVRWRETMRQALEAAVEAQNRPDVMGDALAKALLRATELEIEAYHLKIKNEKLLAERDECERQLQNSFSKMGEILEERNVLRAALKPFAESVGPESDMMSSAALSASIFTFGQLRAAAAALKETGDER